jgi:hypothetical protein
LVLALAVHVLDEAANDFLSVWNPAVVRIRRVIPLLPLPTFAFHVWLGGLVLAVVLLLLLSPYAFRGRRWMVPVSYAFAVLMIGNGLFHLTVSIVGAWFMPGVYSSPLLLAAGAHLLVRVRRAEPARSVR